MQTARGDMGVLSYAVYEDDDIVVSWHPGQSDFVVVAFGGGEGRLSPEIVERGAGKQKIALAALRVVPKTPGRYPAASLAVAVVRLEPYLAKYGARITFGEGVDGAAAVKFSALFKASAVVAFAPQVPAPEWSIAAEEVAGKVFFLQGDEAARAQADGIAAAVPAAHVIHVPHVGGALAQLFSTPAAQGELLALALSDDGPGVARLARGLRISGGDRLRRLTQWVEQRRSPAMAVRLSQLAQSHPGLAGKQVDVFWNRAATEIAAGREAQAAANLATLACADKVPARYLILKTRAVELLGQRAALEAHTGAVIAYDLKQGCCVTTAEPLTPLQYPVVPELEGPQVRLVATIGSLRVALAVDAAGQLGAFGEAPAQGVLFDLQWIGDEGIGLRHADRFLSARPGGRLLLSAPNARLWERFRVVAQTVAG